MTTTIGTNLRKLRLKKGLTQEQVAEVLGVSPQAISRWENDTAYPDITLLPGLAIFYNTSVDAIVGMDELRKEETLCRIHTQINELVIAGKPDEAIGLIRESLKTYPGDYGLTMSLGETLAHKTDDPAATREAITIAQRVLSTDEVSMKAKSTTAANLLFLYLRSGQMDEARALIRSLPHIWESREILMPEVFSGDAYAEELRKCIIKALTFLCQKIEATPGRQLGATPEYIQLGVDFNPKKSTEEMLAQIGAFLNR